MRANLLPYTARRTLAGLMAVVVAVVVGGCAKSEPAVAAEPPPAAKSCRVVANLEQHAIALTRQLVASNRGIGAKAPVAVTSLVTMKDLRTVSDSGNLLAELLAAQLQRAGGGHEQEVAEVGVAGAAEVGVAEADDGGVGVLVAGAVLVHVAVVLAVLFVAERVGMLGAGTHGAALSVTHRIPGL